MNKYQEALEWFANMAINQSDIDAAQWADETLQELVDKATPMKPFLLVEHKKPKKRQYQCPRCGNACLVRYAPFERNENRHCYHCGQAIDWREDE